MEVCLRGWCLCLHVCTDNPLRAVSLSYHSAFLIGTVSTTMLAQFGRQLSIVGQHHRKSWLESRRIRRHRRPRRAAGAQHSIPFERAAMDLIPPPLSLTFGLSITTVSGPQMPGDLQRLASNSANQTGQHHQRTPIYRQTSTRASLRVLPSLRRRSVREHHHHLNDPGAKVPSWARAVEFSRRPSTCRDGQ